MTALSTKASVFAKSIVTWATVSAVVITAALAAVQSGDVLPDNWVEPTVTYGGSALAFLGAITTVIKRVMPVPVDGVQVLTTDAQTVDVHRGWGEGEETP